MLDHGHRARQAITPQPQEGTAPRLLSIPDAARYMGCTVWFVRTLIWSRQVQYLKLGKRFLLDRTDLDRFIDSQKSVR